MFSQEILLIFLFLFIIILLVSIYIKYRYILNKYSLECSIGMATLAVVLMCILIFIDYPSKIYSENSENVIDARINTDQSAGGIKQKKIKKRQPKKERFQGQSKQQRLQEMCGLPDSPETSHCFADSTHHTCCMLGPKTQKGIKGTGNDLTPSAKKAYMKKHGLTESQLETKLANEDISLPWCTCTGSSVCSQYDRDFGDTKISFINNPKSYSGEVAKDIGTNCEKYVKDLYDIRTHGTPSIKPDLSNPNIKACEKALKKHKI